jgi:thiol-disulfide isomerase/thioredoxin
MHTSFFRLAVALFGAALAGCTSDTGEEGEDGGGDTPAPAEFKGGGQVPIAGGEAAYPDEPPGYAVGAVIPDFGFVGYADYTNPSLAGAQLMRLSDFYNPTGTDVFPAGSPFAGQPKPKVINLIMSSAWCGPCKIEAKEILPGLWAKYKSQGGWLYSVILEGPQPGEPAKMNDITNWAKAYSVNYPISVDPSEQVMALFEPAFPGNMIIRTKDMRIMKMVAGVPDQAHWTVFEQVMKGEDVQPQK